MTGDVRGEQPVTILLKIADARTLHPGAVRQGHWTAPRRNSVGEGAPYRRRPASLSPVSIRRPFESTRHRGVAGWRNGQRDCGSAQLRAFSDEAYANLSDDGRARPCAPEVSMVQRWLFAGPLQARSDGRAVWKGRSGPKRGTADYAAAVRDPGRYDRGRRGGCRGSETGGFA